MQRPEWQGGESGPAEGATTAQSGGPIDAPDRVAWGLAMVAWGAAVWAVANAVHVVTGAVNWVVTPNGPSQLSATTVFMIHWAMEVVAVPALLVAMVGMVLVFSRFSGRRGTLILASAGLSIMVACGLVVYLAMRPAPVPNTLVGRQLTGPNMSALFPSQQAFVPFLVLMVPLYAFELDRLAALVGRRGREPVASIGWAVLVLVMFVLVVPLALVPASLLLFCGIGLILWAFELGLFLTGLGRVLEVLVLQSSRVRRSLATVAKPGDDEILLVVDEPA